MKILLVGCGNMGGAMLQRWLMRPDIARIDVVDPHAPTHPDGRVHIHKQLDAPLECDIVVLAIKPQAMESVCHAITPFLPQGAVILSVAAGVSLTKLASLLGANRGIVRAMPNTPAAIGQGVTGYIKNKNTQEKQIINVISLIENLGIAIELSDEKDINSVTAISGSGPAYLYAFTEQLENAALSLGLAPEIAVQLARQTVIGAAALMAAQPDQPAHALRHAVTSPGGTTEAGLKILLSGENLKNLLEKTAQAAQKKAEELA